MDTEKSNTISANWKDDLWHKISKWQSREETINNRSSVFARTVEQSKNEKSYVEIEDYVDGLLKSKQNNVEAIEFKDWCESGKEWFIDNNEQHTHTTEELYKIFKSEKLSNQ